MIALVAFALIIGVFLTWVFEGKSYYNTILDPNYETSLSSINETISKQYERAQDLEEKVSKTEDVSATDVITLISGSVIEALLIPVQAIKTMFPILKDIGVNLGIDKTVMIGIESLIIMAVVFVALKAILRGSDEL